VNVGQAAAARTGSHQRRSLPADGRAILRAQLNMPKSQRVQSPDHFRWIHLSKPVSQPAQPEARQGIVSALHLSLNEVEVRNVLESGMEIEH
jgi:hypothetical protein